MNPQQPRRSPADESPRWLDHPANVRKVYYAVWIGCAALLVAELFIDRHGETPLDHLFGFYGWYGLVSCVALVLAAKLLRRVVMRPENYYDDDR